MDLETLTYRDIAEARERTSPFVTKTPLVPFFPCWDLTPGNNQIHLKLENLHPVGSFKYRGALNAISLLAPEDLKNGIYALSSGNFAMSVAWISRKFGIPCGIIVPDTAPETKVQAIENLGARVKKIDFDAWCRALEGQKFEGMAGTFLHPTVDPAVIAGNGTIGLEILEDLPDVDTILVPYGGGSMACGIAVAVKHIRPEVKVYAVEVSTSPAFKTALDAGKLVVIDYKYSLADGLAGKCVQEELWTLSRNVLDGSIVVTPKEVAEAIKLLVERGHVVAEGAGAVAVAAAMTGKAGPGKVVCIVSGGNIDTDKLVAVLQGLAPK